jgi:cellulose synthase/poly-beta-1,6-N-acetylglucosamine synthase-like glycosyltransferase
MALTHVILPALVVLANLIILPYFVFILLIAAASLLHSRLPRRQDSTRPRSRFLIIVPAHDEESGIAETVQSCLAIDYPKDHFELNVIADNCTDETAKVARQAGAIVVERFDSSKKSKGYAIEYLLESLQESGRFDDFDGYVIIDADTVAASDLLTAFDEALVEGYDWLQAYYTVANPDASWRTRLMTFAFSLVNGVALYGQNLIGLSAGFRGNGMCFSTRGLRRFPFRTYGLVEDIEFAWDLRIAGEWIKFIPETRVAGKMVSSSGPAAVSQRKRWEYGRNELKRTKRAKLWNSPHLNLAAKIGSILELTMPTMARLAAVFVALTVLNLAAVMSIASPENPMAFWALVATQSLMTLALTLYGLSPFVVLRLPWQYAITLACFPVYAVWKLTASRGGKPREWVRTARES